MLVEQFDAVPSHESKRDNADGHANIDQVDIVSSESDRCDDVVETQAEVEKGDQCNRLCKTRWGSVRSRMLFVLFVFGKMVAHQPNQIASTQNH